MIALLFDSLVLALESVVVAADGVGFGAEIHVVVWRVVGVLGSRFVAWAAFFRIFANEALTS